MTYTYDFKYRTQPNPHPPLNPIQTSQGYYPRLNTGALGELKTYYTKILTRSRVKDFGIKKAST